MKTHFCQYEGCGKEFTAPDNAHPKYCDEHKPIMREHHKKAYAEKLKKERAIRNAYKGEEQAPLEYCWWYLIFKISSRCNPNALAARALGVVGEREDYLGERFHYDERREEVAKVGEMLTCEECFIRHYCPMFECEEYYAEVSDAT